MQYLVQMLAIFERVELIFTFICNIKKHAGRNAN